MKFGPTWTEREDAVLISKWRAPAAINTWAHLLPGRTPGAIEKRGAALKLGPRPRKHDWSEEQDAALARLWASTERITAHLDLFGNHSVQAIYARAYTLGLGKRATPPRGQAPIAWPLIKRELRKGPAHRYRLADVLRLHAATVAKYLNLQHDAEAIHIVDWHRRTRTSAPIPVYKLGSGTDVPKPAPLSNAEKMRRVAASAKQRRILAAEPVRGINPFATVAGLVQVPVGQRGRIISQMRDHDSREIVA